MLMATPPGWSRGRASGLSAGLILVVALSMGGGVGRLNAQVPPPPKGEAPKADEPAKPDERAKAAAVDVATVKKADATEVFIDPNAEAARVNTFAELNYAGKVPTKAENDEVASGAVGTNRALVTNYINYWAAQLTKKDAIDEMMKLDGDQPAIALRISVASVALARPFRDAQSSPQYKSEYTRALIPVVKDLLNRQMYARIAGMTALSCSIDPAILPICTEVLRNPEQLLAVKDRAAVGIIVVAASAKNPLDPASQVIPAADALVDFLNKDETRCWPVHLRAVEALGYLRLAGNPQRDQGDYAGAALRLLADPQGRPEVRAKAAWALGMMNVSRNSGKFNFALLVHHCGLLAVDLATRVVAADPTNQPRAKALTNQLLYVGEALSGDAAIGSGLMRNGHPNAVNIRSTTEKIAQAVLAESKLAVELSDAPKAQRVRIRTELTARAGELKTLLTKTAPTDWKLVPEGPEYRPTPPAVAAGAPR